MKAIFNNIKLAIFVYLIVALICTVFFVFVPRGLQSNVEMLQQSVQSKQLLVNSLKAHQKKKVFTVPKEATTWVNQLPPDPQINRALIRIDSLLKQTDVNFQSISLSNAKTNDVKNTDPNQILDEILGRNGQTRQGQQSQSGQSTSDQKVQQGSQSIPIKLSINGSYYSVLDFLYGLTHSDRLIRIDSIQLNHDASSAQQNGKSNSQIPFVSQRTSVKSNTNTRTQTLSGIQSNGTSNTNSSNTNMAETANSLLQALLAGGLNALQQNGNGNIAGVAQSTTAVLPLDQENDKVNVSLVLSIFYMPEAAVLGNLPDLPLYPQSKRNNPFVP